MLVAELEPGTGAWGTAKPALSACHHVVITDGRHVGCWTAAPPTRRWQRRVAGGSRVEFAALLPASDGCLEAFVLLVTSHGPTAQVQATVVTVSPTGCDQAVLATAALVTDLHDGAPTRPTFSNLAPCGGSGGSLTLAASLQQGKVHLVHAERSGSGGAWRLSVSSHDLCQLLTADPGTPAAAACCMGASVVVESLALGPASSFLAAGDRLHCTILYASHWLAGGLRVKHIACLEAAGTALHSCCWNVHPSTSLVSALPGGRTLVASREGLALVHADVPHDRQLVRVSLRGTPTCAAALSEGVAVVGDSAGQLLLLDLRRLEVAPLPCGLLPAPPTSLAFLPAPPAVEADEAAPAGAAADEVLAGALFVGSSGGSSVFLEVPQAALAGAGSGSQGGSRWREAAAAPEASWQALPAAESGGQLASLAPVNCCQLIQDPSGCGDNRLLLCCGEAPFGRLALGRLAAALVPLAIGGNDLPGLVRLLGLKAAPSAPTHRYLLLSSDAAADAGSGWTTVLEAAGGGLHAAALPGMQLEAATLLASALPGGTMLQVTPQGAFVFRPATGALQSSWHPPSGAHISLAAQHGQYIALAHGSAEAQVLYCSSGAGRLQEERLLALPQQASALALFQLGGGPGEAGEGGEVWLAAGLWVSNEVLLQPLSGEQPACRLSLGDRQPRSLLVCQLGGTSRDSSSSGGSGSSRSRYLVVGTSSGELLWWRLAVHTDAFGATSGMELQECGWARAGLAPVTLHLLPQAAPAAVAVTTSDDMAAAASSAGGSSSSSPRASSGPCVLAVSDQALLLGPDPLQPARLAAARVHGAQGLTAACPLATGELPGSALAHIGSSGELAIGGLDPALQFRWDELAMTGGAAASSAAYHADSGCAAVACTEPDGNSSLRLVDVGSMQELAAVPMHAGASITALAVASLPCSSRWAQQAPPGAAAAPAVPHGLQELERGQPGCKPFLLVAVCAGGAASPLSGLAEEEAGPSEQPWWRHQHQQQQGTSAPASSSSLHASSPSGNRVLVYEVRHRQAAQVADPASSSSSNGGGSSGTSSSSRAYELVLHGSCALSTAIFSLAAVQSEAAAFAAGAGAAAGSTGAGKASNVAADAVTPEAAAVQHPMLAAGCHDGNVRLYRLFVDDAGLEGKQAVERGLEAITAAIEPLRLADSGTAALPVAQPHAVGVQQRGLWQQRVALQLVSRAATCFEGIPISLAVQGSTLFALDLLSSITAFAAQPAAAGQLPALLPVAADLSGRHVGAMLALSDTAVLAGLHGGGLLLMQRDTAGERDRQAAARQRWEQLRERGGGAAGEEDGDGAAAAARAQGAVFVPTLRDAVQLDTLAGYDSVGSIAGGGLGLLGVPLRRLEELQGEGSSMLAATARAATLVCTDGTVVAVHLLQPEQHQVMWQLEKAAELTAEPGGASGRLSIPPPADLPPLAAAPARGLDGGTLAAAFLQPAWQGRLLKAAPPASVQQGRAILESHGLL